MLWLSWVMLVLSTYFSTPKKISNITRLPNEKIITSSNRKMSESNRRSKNVNSSNAYNHPYTRRESTSFENVMPYNGYKNKYAIPIAPHLEKVELPESYDNSNSNALNVQQESNILSRHYPATSVPGGWVEYNTPHSTSPYYYQDHDGHQENPWYPNVANSRVI